MWWVDNHLLPSLSANIGETNNKFKHKKSFFYSSYQTMPRVGKIRRRRFWVEKDKNCMTTSFLRSKHNTHATQTQLSKWQHNNIREREREREAFHRCAVIVVAAVWVALIILRNNIGETKYGHVTPKMYIFSSSFFHASRHIQPFVAWRKPKSATAQCVSVQPTISIYVVYICDANSKSPAQFIV
jgi:hypothetical protein